ncbi:MAG: transcription factor S [Candidatus Woesearchaeota archaeon]
MKPQTKSGKKVMTCSCGFKTTEVEDTKITETVKDDKPDLAVIEQEAETHPLVDQECPKCNHDKAYTWEIQTRSSDEPATKFFKCEKCKHIWRDYN